MELPARDMPIFSFPDDNLGKHQWIFTKLLALQLPRLGKRELILVLFVHLFDLCLFGFVGFLFLVVSGKCCGL